MIGISSRIVLALFAVIFLVPYEPQYSPIYLWSECAGTRPHVSVGWYSPPDEVMPFEEDNPGMAGYLYVYGDEYWQSYFLHYLGPESTPFGIMHRWVGYYTMPDREYRLSSVVIGNGGAAEYGVVPESIDPGCYTDDDYSIYLPIIRQGVLNE